MFKNKTTPSVEDRVTSGVDNARLWATPKIESALAWAEMNLGEGKVRAKIAGDRAAHQMEETVQKVTPQVQTGLATAGTALAGAANRVASNVDHARHQVQDEYLPAASARLAGLAGQANRNIHQAKVNPAVEEALVKLTGDKKAVKNLRKAGENYTKAAQKELKKRGKKPTSGKAWLVVGIVAAAGAAAVAVWQLTKPVDDPWKNPAPQPLGQTPSGAATQSRTTTTTIPAGTAGQTAAGTAAAPTAATAPSSSGGNVVVDTAEERVDGTPGPRAAGQ